MAITHYYVDPVAGADVPLGGTLVAPWATLQYALNTIARDAVNGDQVNLKAGGISVLAAGLTLAAYGAPTAAAPLVVRGYTAAANDGGRGSITLAATLQLTASAYNYISLIDLDITGAAAAVQWMVSLGAYCYICKCSFTAGGYLHAVVLTSNGVISGCYATGCTGYSFGAGTGHIVGNYAVQTSTGTTGAIRATGAAIVSGNIVLLNHVNAYGIDVGNQIGVATGNIVYNRAAGTKIGIRVGDALGLQLGMAINNIVCGFSGVGGVGIGSGALNAQATGYNAFWNNTADESYGHQLINDMGNDVALAADPFTDAANGDFSLTAAGKTALRGVGWPGAYLGAHALTDGHVTIGAVQYGEAEAGGGGPILGSRIVRPL